MKKWTALLIIFVCVGTASFAQMADFEMSAGAGLLFDMSFGNGLKFTKDGFAKKGDYDRQNITSFGGFAFFDATYAEVDLNFAYGLTKNTAKVNGKKERDNKSGSMLQLGFGALGKYPLDIGDFTVFPLLGVNYNMVLSSKYDGKKLTMPNNESIMKWFSQFGILGGGGIDFPINDSLYFRVEALAQFRLPNKSSKDTTSIFNLLGSNAKATWGIGPRIKLGVGYKF